MKNVSALAILTATTAFTATAAQAITNPAPPPPPADCYAKVWALSLGGTNFSVDYYPEDFPGTEVKVGDFLPADSSYDACIAAYNKAWNAGYMALVNNDCPIDPPASGYVDVDFSPYSSVSAFCKAMSGGGS